MRLRKLTPIEVAERIVAIPERDDLPAARTRVGPHAVAVRWWLRSRSVAVIHDNTGTYLELWESGGATTQYVAGPARPLVPLLRRAMEWMLDGGDRPGSPS